MTIVAANSKPELGGHKETLEQISKMLSEIKFGSVEIVIHDSKVTQIERKEKIRPNYATK